MQREIKEGFVYVMSNPSMPNLYKIGFTCNLKKRLYDLNSYSSTPLPFKIIYSARVDNAEADEKLAHSALAESRVNKKREFFKAQSKIELIRKVRSVLSEIKEEEIEKRISKKVLDIS